jgi:hypothetical protein
VEICKAFDEYEHQTIFIDQINPDTTEEDIEAALIDVSDSIQKIILKKINQTSDPRNQLTHSILVSLKSKEVAEQVVRKYNGINIKGSKVRIAIALSKWERL